MNMFVLPILIDGCGWTLAYPLPGSLLHNTNISQVLWYSTISYWRVTPTSHRYSATVPSHIGGLLYHLTVQYTAISQVQYHVTVVQYHNISQVQWCAVQSHLIPSD